MSRRYGVTTVVTVWVRDRGVCQLCGQPIAPADVSMDHRRPRFFGGRATVENLQLAHQRCNSLRGFRRNRPIAKEGSAQTA